MLPSYISIVPTCHFHRAVAESNQVEVLEQRVLAGLGGGIRFDMADVQDQHALDVQVNSSLPDREVDTVRGEDVREEDTAPENVGPVAHPVTDELPSGLPQSPRLASKFKRETVVETPATGSRFVDEGAADLETQASPVATKLVDESFVAMPNTYQSGDGLDLSELEPKHGPALPSQERQNDQPKARYSAPPFDSVLQSQPFVEGQSVSATGSAAPVALGEAANISEPGRQEVSEATHSSLEMVERDTARASEMSSSNNKRKEPSLEPEATEGLVGKRIKIEQAEEIGTPTQTSGKRGRPWKLSKSSAIQSPHYDRPRRSVRSTETNNEFATPPSTLSKKRGRPSKSSLGQRATNDVSVSPLTESKKRGRPRKVVAESTNDSTPSMPSFIRSGRRESNIRRSSTPEQKIVRAAFSHAPVKDQPQKMKDFKKYIGEITDSHMPGDFDVLVVGSSALKKTPKLLIAVATGKPVVTDEWVKESVTAKKLLPMDRFFPKPQMQWGYYPADRSSRRSLFEGKTLHVTPALKRFWEHDYRDIEILAKAMGAKDLVSKTTRGLNANSDTVVLGLEKDDIDCASFVDKGNTCYTRDLLPYSALRGLVEWSSEEFQVQPTATPTGQKKNGNGEGMTKPSGRRGRPRKSK